MKLFNYSLLAVAAVTGLASCSNENEPIAPVGDGVMLTLQLSEGMATRGTFGDQDQVDLNTLQWTVFEVNGEGAGQTLTPVFSETKTGAFGHDNNREVVTLQLAKGKTYQVAFYAENDANDFVTYNEGALKVDYSKANSNDNIYDAFIGKSKVFTVANGYAETINMNRPFAQLNWGTDDLKAPAIQYLLERDMTYAVTVSSGLYTDMDILSGNVSGEVTAPVSFAPIAHEFLPTNEFPVKKLDSAGKPDPNAEPYRLLCMNYLLTGDGTINCQLDFAAVKGMTPVAVSNAPVKMNYRTNIYGSLLTAPANFNILVDRDFLGDLKHEVKVVDAASFSDAILNPAVTDIVVENDLDLSGLTTEQMTFAKHKTLTVNKDAVVKLGATNRIEAFDGITINGGGTIHNSHVPGTRTDGHDPNANTKNLIVIFGGKAVIENVTLVNDMDNFVHGIGSKFNCATVTYYPGTDLTIKNAKIYSGGFAVCGWRGANSSNVTMIDSYFESDSSNQDVYNGNGYWAYCLRLNGDKVTMTNCEVVGIQGGVSFECNSGIIKSGKYSTHNSEAGVQNAFYAVYVTAGSKLTIEGGEFSAPNNRAPGIIKEGTSCVVSGDNDVNMPDGIITIKGGKFSGKPYDHVTKKVYNPEGGEWKVLTGQDPFIFSAK